MRLGDFAAAAEAALCYSRYLGKAKAAEAAAAEEAKEALEDCETPVSLTENEVFAKAKSEGLSLVRADTLSGYKGVKKITKGSRLKSKYYQNKPFRAKGSRSAANGLGYFATAAEAALAYARHQESKEIAQVCSAADALRNMPGCDSNDDDESSDEDEDGENDDDAEGDEDEVPIVGGGTVGRVPIAGGGSRTVGLVPMAGNRSP